MGVEDCSRVCGQKWANPFSSACSAGGLEGRQFGLDVTPVSAGEYR